jgi:predicted dehydrogenase
MSLVSRDEDIAQARVEFTCGAVAVFSASRCSPNAIRSMRWMGPLGLAAVDMGNHAAEIIEVSPAAAELRNGNVEWTAEQKQQLRESMFSTILPRSALTVEPCNALFEEQRDWLEAIRCGRAPRVDILAGRRAVALAESICRQIEQGSGASMPPIIPFPVFPNLSRRAA